MIRLTPSSVFERCPSWSPWESHPIDDRRGVMSIPTGCGVAACTSSRLGAALVGALLDANIRSIAGTQGGSLTSENEGGGRAVGAADPQASTYTGGS